MSLRLKRFLVTILAALPTTFLFPAQASAAACVNAVNAAILGNAEQENDCETNVDVDAGLPGVPELPTP